MQTKLIDTEPDAFVYRGDDGHVLALCRHCAHQVGGAQRDAGAAWSGAARHLWSTHSLRRVWIDESNPAFANAVQMALPIVIAHHTTRTR